MIQNNLPVHFATSGTSQPNLEDYLPISPEQFHKVDIYSLTQNDIDKRSLIFKTLVIHTAKLLSALFQADAREYKEGVFEVPLSKGRIYFSLRANLENFKPSTTQGFMTTHTYADIIACYAEIKEKSYKNSINDIYTHITKHKENYSLSQENSSKLAQEMNPIKLTSLLSADVLAIEPWLEDISRYDYKNESDNLVGINFVYTNNENESVSIFYAYWRHSNSEKLFFLPHRPEKAMVYNLQDISLHPRIYVASNEKVVHEFREKFNPHKHAIISISPSIANITEVDFSLFSGKTLIFDYKENHYEEAWVKELSRLAKQHAVIIEFHYITLEVHSPYPPSFIPKGVINIEKMLERKEVLIESDENAIIMEDSGFSLAGQNFIGHDRQREILLEPLIESGTTVWIYGAEKTGKTMFGLTLAYILSREGKTLGPWRCVAQRKVLYIDGEMAGDKMNKLTRKVMNAYGEPSSAEKPFDAFSFCEDPKHYDTILDDDWLQTYNEKLIQYDVIIFDNYKSIYDNNRSAKPFLAFLKKLRNKGITCIVLDHTNAEGGIQGDSSKARDIDLALKIQKASSSSDDHILIVPERDRHGVAVGVDSWTFKRVITDDSLKFEYFNAIEESRECISLNYKDMRILYSYLLVAIHGFTQVQVYTLINENKADMSNYINSAKYVLGEKQSKPSRLVIENPELFCQKFEELKNTSKEDALKALEQHKK